MRPRITRRLEQAAKFPVTLIVAPAGFGKSVALRDFLEAQGIDALRYDVNRDDGTLLAFVRRLSEALAPAAPGAIASFSAIQEIVLAADEPVRQLSDWFAEHLKGARCTVVIDDLHYAAIEPASIALLADVIERTSAHVRWIIAARSDVGLPIASWVAYGRMDIPVSEEDLRFTADEALNAASETSPDIDPQEAESLRQLTEGWPVALTIALRTRTHAADLRTASAGTREMIYRYLAEQVFGGLSQMQRAFVLSTAVFSNFDTGVAEALGAPGTFLSDLRGKVAFLNEISPGQYRYHELFRDFLEMELRRSGEREWRAALLAGAALLEKRGQEPEALGLLVKAHEADAVAGFLRRCGFALFEQGYGALLRTALDALPAQTRGMDALFLGLEAMIDASLGRFQPAEANFTAAIARAGEQIELRTSLVHRYAIELVRNDRDCVEFLEPHALGASIPARMRTPLLGTLATGYVLAGRNGDAIGAIVEALRNVDESTSDEEHARLLQQAAYVHRYAGSSRDARQYADAAIELALRRNLYELAARAYSVLYTIEHDEADDPLASLAILERIDECARKGASMRARLFAMIAAYEIEVDRGNEERLEQLDAEIREYHANERLISTALLPARALRMAWNGGFARAYALLSGSATAQLAADQRALRSAEIALYAACAGLPEEASGALAAASEALAQSDAKRRRSIRAHLLLALVEIVRGHESAAHRHIGDAEESGGTAMHRMRALTAAVRAYYRVWLEQDEPPAMERAFEHLQQQHLGGLVRLMRALPVATGAEAGLSVLTAAEREVLRLLAAGSSTKHIALKTGRSPHTIDTHIRSICRKLECSGRREAIALATSRGWVQTGRATL